MPLKTIKSFFVKIILVYASTVSYFIEPIFNKKKILIIKKVDQIITAQCFKIFFLENVFNREINFV